MVLLRRKHARTKKHGRDKERKTLELPQISIKTWSYNVKKLRVFDSYDVGPSKIYIGLEQGSPTTSYIVVDPPVDERELEELQKIASELIFLLDEKELGKVREGTKEGEKKLREVLESKGIKDHSLQYLIVREIYGFGPIDPIMRDPSIEDISCNRSNEPVYVLHRDYGYLKTNIVFTEEELDTFVQKLAHKAGKSISRARPRLDNARLPGGHRLACTYKSEISPTSSFVIRKFPEKPWTITKLMAVGTLTPEITAWLWLLLECKLPILIAGEMGSGKTSLSNAICGLIPPNRKVGSVEDVAEFKIPHPNWYPLYTREPFSLEEKGGITLLDLIKQLLRSRVDYIIVNEIRGEEAQAWFQAISSGHGGVTTIHAADFKSVMARLSMPPMNISPAYLTALSTLIYIARYKLHEKYVRRIREISDFSIVNGQPIFTKVFWYDPKNDTYHSLPPEDMCKLNSAKKIMSLKGWNEDELIKEYSERVEFLKWLEKYSKVDPRVMEVDGLIEYFGYFYRYPKFFKDIKISEHIEGKEEEEKKKDEHRIRPIIVKQIKKLRTKPIEITKVKKLKSPGAIKVKKRRKRLRLWR